MDPTKEGDSAYKQGRAEARVLGGGTNSTVIPEMQLVVTERDTTPVFSMLTTNRTHLFSSTLCSSSGGSGCFLRDPT